MNANSKNHLSALKGFTLDDSWPTGTPFLDKHHAHIHDYDNSGDDIEVVMVNHWQQESHDEMAISYLTKRDNLEHDKDVLVSYENTDSESLFVV